MVVKNFHSELQFALIRSNDKDEEFIKNFDVCMARSLTYIQRLISPLIEQNGISSEKELKHVILDDYEELLKKILPNKEIESLCLHYFAHKYLQMNRDELKKQIEKITTKDLNELLSTTSFKTNFEDNLFLAACYLKFRHAMFKKDFKNSHPKEYEKTADLQKQNGKDFAFTAFYNEFSKYKNVNYVAVRHNLRSIYWLIYGVEDPEFTPDKKSSVLKIKEKFVGMDFVEYCSIEIVETLKEKLINSITYSFSLLEKFNSITDSINIHNINMYKIRLPGLQITTHSEESIGNSKSKDVLEAYTHKLTNLNNLMSAQNLKNLDIESLLQLNSFYNNRLAKVLENYAKSLFFLENIGGFNTILQNYTIGINFDEFSSENISFDFLKNSLTKFYLLLSYAKEIFSEAHENELKFIKHSSSDAFKIGSTLYYDYTLSIKLLEKAWEKDYFSFFSRKMPECHNDIFKDSSFVTQLYNGIYLAYQNKSDSIKLEYAYWFLAMKNHLKSSANFGIVLDNYTSSDAMLLASDPSKPATSKDGSFLKLNFPSRVHVKKSDFVDFWKSYTGSTLIRVYEGFNDFIVDEKYISTQILCPVDPFHIQYLSSLRKYVEKKTKYRPEDKKSKSGKKPVLTLIEKIEGTDSETFHSWITYFNKNFVSHLEASYGMKRLFSDCSIL